ncbi:MAG: hypothetical protein EBR86_16430 [Planctomycetia bacterium]|nr:hypothetical protein [Planctomycetia bacterium]
MSTACHSHWVRRFILHHGKRHPVSMGEREVNAFLTDLAARERIGLDAEPGARGTAVSLRRRVGSAARPDRGRGACAASAAAPGGAQSR